MYIMMLTLFVVHKNIRYGLVSLEANRLLVKCCWLINTFCIAIVVVHTCTNMTYCLNNFILFFHIKFGHLILLQGNP